MIDWCAWCQRFVGESLPFEDLAMTHVMCEACAACDEKIVKDESILREIADFIQSVGRALTAGWIPRIGEVLDEAHALGIRDSDLFLGLLQPTLYEIGRRFEAGAISVAEEHRVSLFVQAMINAVESRSTATDAKPQVLLATAPGNTHTIGVRFLAKALNEAGIPVEVMLGASADEILQQLERGLNLTLGISIALPSQTAAAEALAGRAKSRHPALRLIAGGIPFKTSAGPTAVPEHFDTVVSHHTVAKMLAEFGGGQRKA